MAKELRKQEIDSHHLRVRTGNEYLLRVFPGLNIILAPGTQGKTTYCRAMVQKTMINSMGGPMFNSVIVVSNNPATQVRWQNWFKSPAPQGIGYKGFLMIINSTQLPAVYTHMSKRYANYLQQIDPSTGRYYTHGPNTLFVADDLMADIEDDKKKKKVTSSIKNMECVKAAATDGRNSGIYFILIGHHPGQIHPACYENAKFIAVGKFKSLDLLEDQIIPKICSQCTDPYPFTRAWLKSMRRDWFINEMTDMKRFYFLTVFNYIDKDNEDKTEMIIFKV